MKNVFLSILRNKDTTGPEFRHATRQLGFLLAEEAIDHLPQEQFSLETPLGTTTGIRPPENILLIPILRSGLALLPSFLDVYQNAKVGFFGEARDENAIAHLYYENLPEITPDTYIIILEPLIATGGTMIVALDRLIELNVPAEKILVCSILTAAEGIEVIQKKYPKVKLIYIDQDNELNSHKFLVPGIGDFGDRYFNPTKG